MPQENTLLVEKARILFRNFTGKEGQYNREGDRNFCLLLDPEKAEELAQDGWNIKTLKPREPGDEPQPYLHVSVSYKGRPPKIVMITSRGRSDIPERMVEILDWADFRQVDLIVRPYEWTVNGKSGIKAYLKSLFVTIEEDYLELKYADVREIGSEEEFVDGEVLGEVVHNQREIEGSR